MTSPGWLEYQTQDTVYHHQVRLLQKTIEYCKTYSAFYRKILNNAQTSHTYINTVNDIEKLPLTTKQDLQKFNDEFFCCDEKVQDIVHTSGSTGLKPIMHPLTGQDLVRLAYNEELSFLCAGLSKNDVVMLSVAMDGFFIAGLAYYTGLRKIGSCILRTGPLDYEQQLHLLKTQPISVIIGVPSNMIKLFEFCERNQLNPKILGIKKLILIGETFRKADHSLNELGLKLSSKIPGATLISTYGNTEIASTFCECDYGKGGHCHPDLCFPEIVDESGKSVGRGKIGDLVVTTFGSEGMPLIRYRTGDITYYDDSICSCGRTSYRIGPILGRRENMLKICGVSIYPTVIEDGINSIAQITDYVIVAEKDNENSDRVAIYLLLSRETEPNFDEKVSNIIRIKALVTPHVIISTAEELQKLRSASGSRKDLRFIDTRRGTI